VPGDPLLRTERVRGYPAGGESGGGILGLAARPEHPADPDERLERVGEGDDFPRAADPGARHGGREAVVQALGDRQAEAGAHARHARREAGQPHGQQGA
jgi:hypothetical protein